MNRGINPQPARQRLKRRLGQEPADTRVGDSGAIEDVNTALCPSEGAVRVHSVGVGKLQTQFADLASQSRTKIHLIIYVVESGLLMHDKGRGDGVVGCVQIRQHGGLEFLHPTLELPVVLEAITSPDPQRGYPLVSKFLRGPIEGGVSTEVESIGVIQYTEKDRFTPGDLLVTDTQPKGAGVVIKVEGRQVDHVVLTADLKAGGAVSAEGRLEVVGLSRATVINIPRVEAPHFGNEFEIAAERGINIEFRAGEHDVPVIAFSVGGRAGDGTGAQSQQLLYRIGCLDPVVDIPRLVPRVFVTAVQTVSTLLSNEARDIPINSER